MLEQWMLDLLNRFPLNYLESDKKILSELLWEVYELGYKDASEPQ